MLEEKKNQMAVRAAELYYCEDLSQQRVGEEMGISRPSVSRLLQRAKEKGYAVAPNSYEGVRITFDSDEVKGWILLRMSLHDPQMPLNIEGVREGDCDKLHNIVLDLLDGFDRLSN